MSDEGKTRRGGARSTGEADKAPQPEAAQAAAPVPTDEPTRQALAAPPLEADDSAGRTKVPRSWLLDNCERVLGVERHVMVAALSSDDRDELTINAARKAVDEFRGKVQNPDTAEEG